MTISQENFLKDPNKYLGEATKKAVTVNTNQGNLIILSAEDYEEYETMKALQEADEDIAAGRVFTHEEVWAEIDEMLEKM